MNNHSLNQHISSDSIQKIGLIVDPINISEYELDFIKSCRADPLLDISLILIKKSSGQKFKISAITWKVIIILERLKLNLSSLPRHFHINNLDKINELRGIVSYAFASGSPDALKRHGFSTIVSFDYQKELLSIKNLLDADVIFFYKNFYNPSNSLSGFDEIIRQEAGSSFSIIKIEKDSGHLRILLQGSFSSALYFSSNQVNIFSRRNYYLLEILRNNLNVSDNEHIDCPLSYKEFNSISDTPSILDQLLYVKQITTSFFSILISHLLRQKIVWRVFYSRKKWSNLTFSEDDSIPNPENGYLADPFIVDKQDRSYIFAERVDFVENKGKIAAYEVGDFPPKDLGIVLEEDFHLSYPFIFEDGDNLYLIPESSKNNDIRLYECELFPGKWRLHSIILDQVSAADSIVFQHQGKWWLFTNLNPSNTNDHCSELFIFSSDSLLGGPWLPHAKNPIYIDPIKARNGGLIFDGQDIYRVSQEQDYGVYGKNININKIILLNNENYIEEKMHAGELDYLRVHHLHSNSSYTVYDKWSRK